MTNLDWYNLFEYFMEMTGIKELYIKDIHDHPNNVVTPTLEEVKEHFFKNTDDHSQVFNAPIWWSKTNNSLLWSSIHDIWSHMHYIIQNYGLELDISPASITATRNYNKEN